MRWRGGGEGSFRCGTYYAVLCYAVLCYDVMCYDVLCCAVGGGSYVLRFKIS